MQSDSQPATLPQVQALADALAGAFNAGRTGDLSAFYTPDARVVPPGRLAVTGADGICGFFSDIRAQDFRDYAVEINDAFAKDTVQIATGRWRLTGPGDDGARHAYEGNWLTVLDRSTGTWRILAQMWN